MKKLDLKNLVTAAFLLALILVLGFTPIGMWNFGVIYISIMAMPVILGTLILGPKWGLLLGLCFGSVSAFIGTHTPSSLVAPILERSAFLVCVMSIIPRLIIPLNTWFVYRVIRKKANNNVLLVLPSVLGALTNTFFYLGSMLLIYVLAGIDNPTILTTLGGIVLAGGLPEAAFCGIIVPAIIFALKKSKLISKTY